MTKIEKAFFKTAIAAALCFGISTESATAATLSQAMVMNAINQADIFSGDSRFSVKVDAEHVSISTYKKSVQDDTENKMQAVFATKAVMDAASGQVTRVTFYFYDYDHLNTGNYKQVDVTAGDIKAFASGQLKEKELLSSISITEGQLPDAASRISSYLQSKQDYPVTTTVKENELLVSSQIDNRSSDLDLRYRALKLATEASDAASTVKIKTIKVSLVNANGAKDIREITFDTTGLKATMNNLTQVLAPLKIVLATASASSLTVVDGVLKAERSDLLARINKLSENGVGVAPFINAFKDIEKEVSSGDETKIKSDIKRLSDSIDIQEKAHKDLIPAKPTTTATMPVASAPPVTLTRRLSRWAFHTEPIYEEKVLRDPSGYIKELEARVTAMRVAPDDYEPFAEALIFFAQTLRANNRPNDAVPFEQRLNSIRKTHPKYDLWKNFF